MKVSCKLSNESIEQTVLLPLLLLIFIHDVAEQLFFGCRCMVYCPKLVAARAMVIIPSRTTMLSWMGSAFECQ